MTKIFRFLLPIGAIATMLLLGRRSGGPAWGDRLSRGSLLRAGSALFGALLLDAWFWRSLAWAASDRLKPAAASCILTPEMTEGPYYIPDEKVRSNITEHRPGTPLQLRLTVVDAGACKPIKNAAVDIWHCDAGGIYSGFEAASVGAHPGGGSGPTDKHTFLRGIQFTNARGEVVFDTIYPGWYRGRTVHIHVKVHLGGKINGNVVHTGQLFFADTLTASVYRHAPYRARAASRDTFNNTDSIYLNGGRQSTLTTQRTAHGGFVGSITMGVGKA